MSDSLMLLLAILWPLLLTGALPLARGRLPAARLLPLAPVPALLLGIAFEESTLNLPFAMLGGILKLDFTGRAFLLLAATFSLAAGLLAQGRIKESGDGERITLFMLLAVSGAIGLALAGDALFFFAASTLLGYSLYGLVTPVSGVTCSPCRVFLALLVVSDLTIFELLLVLAHEAGGTNFSELRHSLLLAEYPGATLSLLLVGFGIKFGLLGFHLWLAPIFLIAPRHVRPLLVGFIFCAGLLGVLRLVPLGAVHWPDAGLLLQWLALFMLLYAVAAGVVQARFRAALAYGVMALSALFVWLLGVVLAQPDRWSILLEPMLAAFMVLGFSLAVLLLLPERAMNGAQTPHPGFIGAIWLAATIMVYAPLLPIAVLAPIDQALTMQLCGLGAAFALLAGRTVWLLVSVKHTVRSPLRTLLAAALVLLLATWFLPRSPLLWAASLFLILTAFVGWLGGAQLARRLPTLPAGDLLGPVEYAVRVSLLWLYHRVNRWMKRAHHRAIDARHRLKEKSCWREHARELEEALGHWPAAMLMLVLLALLLGLWGGIDGG